MESPKPNVSYQKENRRFLKRLYNVKEDFLNQYEKLYGCDKTKAKLLYYQILSEVKQSVEEGATENFKRLSNILHYIDSSKYSAELLAYYEEDANLLKNVNLIILACYHNSTAIVEHILDNHSTVLNDLLLNKKSILPDDQDERCHTAFYYAIHSGNVAVLRLLIEKWPGNYFATNSEKLDEILSRTYEELKLKNVTLSKEVEIFVEDKLINLRFFSNGSNKVSNYKLLLGNINERIGMVIDNVSSLHVLDEVEEKFMFTAKFIAQNISILKQQLKSTYDRLPWEEIEFCLISFILSYIKKQEINLFYQASLNKAKILKHLSNFAINLENVRESIQNLNVLKLSLLPKTNRDDNVKKIINNYPEFEELYNDYREIRDIHSLEKISNYVKLASSADPKGREGQLIVIRCLQVIGEYLKNTLESPKLSSAASETLLFSLPSNTRRIFISLRNSLSHAYSVSKRIEIEQNHNADYFIGIQNDTKKIGNITTYMLYKKKIKVIKDLLKKIIDFEDIDELKKIALLFNRFKIDSIVNESHSLIEYELLESLIEELNKCFTEKTAHEAEILKEINDVITYEKTKLNRVAEDFVAGVSRLSDLYSSFLVNNMDSSDILLAKHYAENMLEHINTTTKNHCLKKIAESVVELLRSCKLKMKCDNLREINRLTCKIINLAKFEMDNLKWVEKLEDNLNKVTFIGEEEEISVYSISDQKYATELTSKLSELQTVLNSNVLNDNTSITAGNINEKLQAVLEMLILDILSILGRSKNYLENNLLFLDENTPLLIGKCLRNHLAHNNTLIDVLLSDPSTTVILNAKKIIMENVINNKKKIGRSIREDPNKFKNRYNQGIETISNQQNMFTALEEGNLENLKYCIARGADVHGRNINLQTALHIAAKGRNLEVVRYLSHHNLNFDVKDTNDQSPLHVAAEYGSASIMQFLIKEKGLRVNDKDNKARTPLHYAAENGHEETIKVLLKHEANIAVKDQSGYSPLHYTIMHNHKDAFVILMKEESNVDDNESAEGFTPLHLAAARGHVDIINHLLKLKADISARSDKGSIPLHLAAVRGHLEAVKMLIFKGSNVNARNTDGYTSLHYAVEYGYEEIATVLLKYGADAGAVDNDHNTPMHYAAKAGYDDIIDLLLKNGANASSTSVTGITPLYLAIKDGHLQTVNLLLKYEPKANVKNRHFLNIALEQGHKEIAKVLMKKVDINRPGVSNITAIHMAASMGHTDMVELLMRNKANVNVKVINHSTPLHAAVEKNITEMVKILLENNADVHARAICGSTPMHVAAMKGNVDVIELLIENNGDVNATTNDGMTPLHLAAEFNHKDAIIAFLKRVKDIDVQDHECKTALFTAVQAGSAEAVEVLAVSGANLNSKNKYSCAPMSAAAKLNHKKVVEILLAHGADINIEGGQPLLFAVMSGNKDMVEILLRNKAKIDFKYDDGMTLLHVAAIKNLEAIGNILIKNGISVNCRSKKDTKPLHIAAELGHEDIIQLLIDNGADPNVKNERGSTALHLALAEGHTKIVNILLQSGADPSVANDSNSSPLDIALAVGHLESVATLLQKTKDSINRAGYKGYTPLHMAALAGKLDLVKLLIDNGANVDVKDITGAKPIHFACTRNCKDIVEYFISLGQRIDEPGENDRTPLHYAAMACELKVAEYLVQQGADVNARDRKGAAPFHLAAGNNRMPMIVFLMDHGAFYNATDNKGRKPIDKCSYDMLEQVLTATDKLFACAHHNNVEPVEDCIESGAMGNAKNTDGVTPLHIAVSKGNEDVVNFLLKYFSALRRRSAIPNVTDKEGLTPLHYAVRSSNLKVVKSLLANGARYDTPCESGRTPLDIAKDSDIINLLKTIDDTFQSVSNNNTQFIKELKKIRSTDTARAIAGAVNATDQNFIAHAILSNFSRVDQLKQLWQDPVTIRHLETAEHHLKDERYLEAIKLYRVALERRREIFYSKDPGALEIECKIGNLYFTVDMLSDAHVTLESAYEQQVSILGPGAKETLATRTTLALILQKQGKALEALKMFEEIYALQLETLGTSDSDKLSTRFSMALVLEEMKKFDDAMNMLNELLEEQKKTLGALHPQTLATETAIVELLHRQGKGGESLKVQRKIYERKRDTLGGLHLETQQASHILVQALIKEEKYTEALEILQERHAIEKATVGMKSLELLKTRQNMAMVHIKQGKIHNALRIYRECRAKKTSAYGKNHPEVEHMKQMVEKLEGVLRLSGDIDNSDRFENLIRIAINNEDEEVVRQLLADRSDVNGTDLEGKTLLHSAVDRGNENVVRALLEKGASVNATTSKGNTPLHIATLKGYAEIAELLMSHANKKKLSALVNAKTNGRGTTALHVAAKNGRYAIVKSLLKYTAIYDVKNDDKETPLDQAKNRKVIGLLTLIGELFEDAQKGSEKIVEKIKAVDADELAAVTNVRNSRNKTLIQVAIMNKHQELARQMLEHLDKPK